MWKGEVKMKTAKYVIVSIYLVTSLLAANCATVGEGTKEQIEAFRRAKTVRITVEESYGAAKDMSLPFESLAQRLLKYAGLRVVGSEEKSYDATLRIQAQGTALGAHYDKGYLYTGARLKGEISFEMKGIHPYKRTFGGELPPPKTTRVYTLPTSPSDAPFNYVFGEFFEKTIFEMIGEMDGVQYWISALEVNDFYRSAMEKLRGIGKPAVEPLITALKDKEYSVRAGAAELLGEMKDSRAVEPLIAVLKDKDAYVRSKAEGALVRIKESRAVEPLITVLRDEDRSVRVSAAYILGQMRDSRAVEPLIAALNDKEASVRSEAIKALTEMKDSRALDPLMTAMMDKDNSVRIEAANALEKLGKASLTLEPLITAMQDKGTSMAFKYWSVDFLVKMKDGRAVKPLIIASNDNDRVLREKATSALMRMDKSAFEPLIDTLKDKESSVRSGAVRTLGKMKDSRAVEPLISALRDEDRSVRVSAAYVLGQMRDARAVEPLINSLNDENSSVRSEAAKALRRMTGALGRLKDSRAVEPLIAALRDKNNFGRREAATALGEIKDSRAVEPLIAALKDEDSRVRDAAEIALNKIRKQ